MSARDGARPGELRASPTVHRVRSMLLPASRRPPKRAVGRARGAWYSRLAESLRRGWIALAWVLWLASSNVHAAAGDPRDWTVDLATQQRQLGRVELRYEPHLEGGADMLAKNIPQWWSQIEQDLALDLPDDLRIIYVDHAGRVADASGMPRWVAGVARPATGEIMIARHGPDGAPTDLRALVRHEMAHVALYRASGGAAVPRWFNEGIAESFENNVDLARFEMLGNLVFGRGVPALDGLEAQFRGADGLDAAGAYAAARDLVNFMRFYDSEGVALRQVLTEMRLGHRFEVAVIRAYGRSMDELAAEWREGLPARFIWIPLLAGGGMPMVVIGPLLLAAWIRRRRLRRIAWARMEREDAELREAWVAG